MSTVVCQKPPTTSGWGCIEALSTANDRHEPEVYVHPLDKRWSSSMLSDKSLEMCTESLGSETGTDLTEEDMFSIMSEESEAARERERRRKPTLRVEARKSGYESLPPPLTILRGVNTIRVQPVREEGRLVMNVVSTAPRRSSVVAQRSNGRLTMCLVEDVVGARDEETSGGVQSGECVDDVERIDGGDEEEESVEEEEEEGKDGINVEVGGKFGIGEMQRPRRCNESERGSSRRLINWETFWVA